MKKSIIVILVLSVLGIPVSTFATGQNFGGQTVTSIATGWSQEGIYVGTSASNTSIDGCGSAFIIDPGNPMFKEMLSLLLSALHTGSQVSLYVDGCLYTGMRLKAVTIHQ